jgi:hypothetical protein
MKENWATQIFSLKDGKENLAKLSVMSPAYPFSYYLKVHNRLLLALILNLYVRNRVNFILSMR